MHEALVSRPSSCIRRLGGRRSEEVRFTRFLRNDAVTVADIVNHAAERTGTRVDGRDILAIQDTSSILVGGGDARKQGYGPVGKGGSTRGLSLHAVLAVDATSGALLGLTGAQIWNRTGGLVTARRGRRTADKESQRWLDGAEAAGRVLHSARQITVVADRESDIYEGFARRPANVHLITRAAQDRAVESGERLFAHIDQLPSAGQFKTVIPAAPGRSPRDATLAVRFAPIVLRAPRHGAAPGLPETVALHVVDIREVDATDINIAIHWRLLTTHPVDSLPQARWIVECYRRRWLIEQFFRSLKTGGFDIETANIGSPAVMARFVAVVVTAAVTVMQLVQARDGTTDQRMTDAFEPDDQPLLQALSHKLGGKTPRQCNPHPPDSLAFGAWVIARLGGWTGYYGKPGPLVMRRGMHDFQKIKLGHNLHAADV